MPDGQVARVRSRGPCSGTERSPRRELRGDRDPGAGLSLFTGLAVRIQVAPEAIGASV